MINLEELFEKHDDEYLKFDRVEKKFHNRPDMHAFSLLNILVPGTRDMVAGAEHDEIYLGVNPDDVIEVITEEQVIDLIRCGVHLDNGNFTMFV